MKKYFLFPMMLLAGMVSCHRQQPTAVVDYEAVVSAVYAQLDSIWSLETMTGEQKDEQTHLILMEAYREHSTDSAGLQFFKTLVSGFCEPEEALALYEQSDTLIRNNKNVGRKIQAIRNIPTVAPGMPYKEVVGVNALTGDTLRLSSFIGGERPVVVDFWASWCSPCRQEIKEHLLALAAKGEVQIVGIAVWEETIADTQDAMENLGITWPIIYTEGRKDSPSIEYGVLGIPTLFLIAPDGTIQASGHTIEDLGLE